jgi:prephenate dehydratase
LHVHRAPTPPWQQLYALEVHGHVLTEPLAKLIPELEQHAQRVQVLGSYPVVTT